MADSIGQTRSGVPVPWPDDDPYTEEFRQRGYRGPTRLLSIDRPTRDVLRKAFPGWEKEDHMDAMLLQAELKKELDEEWSREVNKAVKQYGDGSGVLVSGVYRDHFPHGVKEKLRSLAHTATKALKASHVHYAGTGIRRSYRDVMEALES